MNNLYLPINKVSDYKCYSVYDKDTIRAYVQQPQLDMVYEFYLNNL